MKLKLHMNSKMLYAFLMALFSVWGWGQTTTIAFNGAEGSPTLLEASNTFSSSTTNSGTPASRIKSGTSSFQRANATGTFISEGVSLSGYTSKVVEIWNSMVSTTTGNGIDGTVDKLEVYVSSTSTFSNIPDVTVNANVSNVRWGMTGTGVISTVAGTPVTQTYSTTGTRTGADAFSKILINLPNAWANVYIKIVTVSNAVEEVWCIDDIAVKGDVATSTNPPTVTASSFTGTVGSSFNEQVVATEGPTSYAVEQGSSLPAGLSLNTSTGIISGTPTVSGNFSANVTATNSIGTSMPATLSFTIGKGNQILTGFTNQSLFLSSPAFTLPVNTDNAGLSLSYTSSSTSVATVSGNTVTITGVGATTITAVQGGNNNWNPLNTQITLTVSPDPITYNGIGRFEKITSISDLTDGYYVFVGDTTNAMVNSVISSKFDASTVTPINNIITNPSVNIVWKLETDAGNVKTIYNEAVDRYVSGGGSNTNVSLATSVSGNSQKWSASVISNLFRFINQAQTGRALWYNGSVFGQYSTANITGYYDLELFRRIETTTWDGNSWSNGLPDTKDVILTGVYTTTSNPAFTAKNITIKNGGVLEINGTNTINAADVTVEDGGNLVIKDSGVLNHTGAFKVLKNGTSVQDKYAFWSSPVTSQNLTAMYPGATPSFITEYNTATDYFVNAASTTSAFAKGYSIKTPAVSNAEFTGTPNNGTQTFTLSTAGNGYNLVGNPYPSNLDLTAFYNANSTRISNTFYFWDNTSNNVTVQGGATTTNVGYATYNPVSQIWTPAPNISVIPAENSVKIGQGFIVKATNAADTSLSFNNNMRIAAPATFYNKNNSSAEGKFWLRLNSSYNTNNTFAVAYINGASNSFDQYDSKAIGTGSDAFYTLAGTQKLVIQGRESFNINDVVPVGAKHFQNGNFTISLVQKEGIFNNGQAIYLHDKVTGTYTDLQNNTYSFTANSGDISSRFEIVYKLGVLSTSEVAKDSFEVYRNGDHFVVKNNKNIDNVIIYDASGRQIQTVEGGSKEIRITLDAKGMYVVKAVSEGKEYTKKIIK